MAAIRYKCATCGEIHEGLPDVGFDAPLYYQQLSEAERRRTALLTEDLCAIADRDFFVRGCLGIPVRGHDHTFAWGVWVSLSQANFTRYARFFREDPPPGEGPYYGWISNRIPPYPETLKLKAAVHLRPGGARPWLELEPTDHPLAIHQREGIELEELLGIIGERLHHNP